MAFDPQSREPIWAQITKDQDVRSIDVRLWFYLFNVRRNAESGEAWPEQRTICREIHCNIHTLSPAVERLKGAGYLLVHERGQNHYHVYTFPHLVLRKEATRENSGDAPFVDSRCGNGQHRALRKGATEPYSKEPKLNNREAPPRVASEVEFEPLPKLLTLKEASKRMKGCDEVIACIKSDPESYIQVERRNEEGTRYEIEQLKPEAAASIVKCEKQKQKINLKIKGIVVSD